jgi:hypothetical protein
MNSQTAAGVDIPPEAAHRIGNVEGMPAAAEYPIGRAARSRDGLPIGPRRGGNVVQMLERRGDLKFGGVDIGCRHGQLSECLISDLMPPWEVARRARV